MMEAEPWLQSLTINHLKNEKKKVRDRQGRAEPAESYPLIRLQISALWSKYWAHWSDVGESQNQKKKKKHLQASKISETQNLGWR